jgi:peroxiredoxin
MKKGRVSTGKRPPDFTLENTRGEAITLSGFIGNKHVYLVFNRGFL